MARIKSGLFELSGIIGNIQFRVVDGEQIAQSAPSGRNFTSIKVLANLSGFGLIQNLYTAVCSSEDMKLLWRKEFPKRRALNTFFYSKNCKTVYTINDIPELKMSPLDNFFDAPQCELIVGPYKDISLKIPKLDSSIGFNQYTENIIEAAGFAYLSGKDVYKHELISIHSRYQDIHYDQEIVLELMNGKIPFNVKNLNDDYPRKELYLVLLTLTEEGKPVRTSKKIKLNMENIV